MTASFVLFFACTAPPPERAQEAPAGNDDAERVSGTPVPETTDTAEPTDTADVSDVGGAEIFGLDAIHEVALVLSEEAWAALAADGATYVPADAILDGEAVPDVGVRLRGKFGSARPLTGKPKLKLDFNVYSPGRRVRGMEALALDSSVVDCSYLKEPLGYRVFEAAGVPGPRTGFAAVTINGDDYGLYVLVEAPDDRFLARVFGTPLGNLYDGKYHWAGGYDFTWLDFGEGVDELFQLEEGIDVGHGDIEAVSDALVAAEGSGDFVTRTGPVLDWPELHREWAAEQWIGQIDGYVLHTNNYRVYFQPGDLRARILPWDLDWAFQHDSAWGLSWGAPVGRLARACLADATCLADHRAAVATLADTLDGVDLAGFLAEADALTAAAALADPRRECEAGAVGADRDALRAWVGRAGDELRAFWSVP